MSQAGDFIGQGQTFNYAYMPGSTNNFFVQDSFYIGGTPSYISFILGTVTSSNLTNTYTILDFSTTQLGTPLQVGTYTNAQRAAFATAGHPGLDVTFQNRGSNTLTGSFTINSISFFTNSSNVRVLGSLDVNFEQHSEGATPALFGHVVYQSSLAVPEPSSMILLGVGMIAVTGLAARTGRRAARSRHRLDDEIRPTI